MRFAHVMITAEARAQAVHHFHDIAAKLVRIVADEIRLIDDIRLDEADAECIDGILIDFDRIRSCLAYWTFISFEIVAELTSM